MLFRVFSAFLCFLVLVKSYRKKNKKFKIGLITPFILLLQFYIEIFRYACWLSGAIIWLYMGSTSAISITGSFRKRAKTPTTWFINSGLERSSWFIDLSLNYALLSSTTRVFPCWIIYAMKWTAPSLSQKWDLLTYCLIRMSLINFLNFGRNFYHSRIFSSNIEAF